MNRDYFARPIQSDRNAHGYGHTVLTPEERGDNRLVWVLVPIVVFGLLVGFWLAHGCWV